MPSHDETIDAVATPDRVGEFVPLPGILAKGFGRDTCGLRFELQRGPGAPADWLLQAGMPYLDEVTLFLPASNGAPGFQSLRLGDRFPYVERPFPHRHFVFPVHLPDEAPRTAYLRVRTESTMLVEMVKTRGKETSQVSRPYI